MMRYLIHLLPEEARRAELDDLRARLAEHIGWNKALEYPTTHVTLVYNIQDAPHDPHPIDQAQLQSALDRFHATGPVPFSLQKPAIFDERHLLTLIEPSARLTALRQSIFEATCLVVAEPKGTNRDRAAKVKVQHMPHLTLAQEIHADPARKALRYLAEHGFGAPMSIQATEIALLARNLDASEPYRITHHVAL